MVHTVCIFTPSNLLSPFSVSAIPVFAVDVAVGALSHSPADCLDTIFSMSLLIVHIMIATMYEGVVSTKRYFR